ncbi:hypothetical protein EW145_g6066 [Phellinidium pouzarii]|uniref:CUE domain-containing protein n=1 Tax=Phellinidium pouzarii TaxID=167371 RepID=A0A4S4KZN0_9AGAM|nr:hypothetical protein EW145_g6066 [Phellinidium pouzarii]
MSMSEVVNVVFALAVIVFIVSWATSSKESPEERTLRAALGFRPKNVSPEMLETISSMFPDMPKYVLRDTLDQWTLFDVFAWLCRDNIRYDLLRTGNIELTTNKIIERGYLDAPPAGYYRVYPRDAQAGIESSARASGASTGVGIAGPSSRSSAKHTSLISRFHLEERVADTSDAINASPEDAGGKAAWEATRERREASLKERKAQMILAARQRMLAQEKVASSSG